MVRTVATGNLVIVVATGIGIANNKTDGGTQRPALPDAREYLYPILFVTGTGTSGLPRASTIHKALQFIQIDFHASGHTVQYATHSGPV